MFEVCLLQLVWVSSCAPILWFSQYRGGSHSQNASVPFIKMNRKTAWLLQATNSCLQGPLSPLWVNQRHGTRQASFSSFVVRTTRLSLWKTKGSWKSQKKTQPSPCVSTQHSLKKSLKSQGTKPSASKKFGSHSKSVPWSFEKGEAPGPKRWKISRPSQGMMPWVTQDQVPAFRTPQDLENSWVFLGMIKLASLSTVSSMGKSPTNGGFSSWRQFPMFWMSQDRYLPPGWCWPKVHVAASLQSVQLPCGRVGQRTSQPLSALPRASGGTEPHIVW